MEMRWGLVPDMAGYPLWRGNVRDDVLRKLVYTNAEFSGAEACAMGFATETSEDPLARAMALAEEIAGKNLKPCEPPSDSRISWQTAPMSVFYSQNRRSRPGLSVRQIKWKPSWPSWRAVPRRFRTECDRLPRWTGWPGTRHEVLG